MIRNRTSYSKKYYQEHKERYNAINKESYQKHREQRKAQTLQYYYSHHEELKKKRRLYYAEHRDEELAKARIYYGKWTINHRQNRRDANRRFCEKLKIEVLTHYGSGKFACIKCGEHRFPCLSIDHINGDGATQRQLGEKGGSRLYYQLKQQGYPKGYQTLCMNCQWVKKYEGREYSKGMKSKDKVFV